MADRENGRIQCFVADSGEFLKEIKKEEFGGEVYAIAYSPHSGGFMESGGLNTETFSFFLLLCCGSN